MFRLWQISKVGLTVVNLVIVIVVIAVDTRGRSVAGTWSFEYAFHATKLVGTECAGRFRAVLQCCSEGKLGDVGLQFCTNSPH